MPREYLSCDWGTSSFRLRWVSGDDVLNLFSDETGCRTIFDRAAQGQDRATLYADFLKGVLSSCAKDWWGEAPAEPKITEFGERLDRSLAPPDQLELVISGMASSSIGWEELSYARIPLALDASNLVFRRIDWERPSWISDTYLISGAATEEDIMRGEETEAIGLLSQLGADEDYVLILPGTHSKHLLIRNRRIETFDTYMTGELFDVLTHQSILKATTSREVLSRMDPGDWKAFDAGVFRVAKAGICASLFQTRTRAILKQCPPGQNTWFLSGLLIGAELSDALKRMSGARILLGGALRLRNLYGHALQLLGAKDFREFSETEVQNAIPTAHGLFLQRIWKR